MKFLKWLLPIVLVTFCSTASFSQMNPNDSLAVLQLRDNLGLSAIPGLASNDVPTWIPTFIDTIYDPVSFTYKIRTINFDSLVVAPATTTTILPAGFITDTDLNFLEFMTLNDNGIDVISGNLYAGTTVAPALKGLNLDDNTIANTPDFFVHILTEMSNLETLRVENSLIVNGNPLTSYTIPTTPSLVYIDFSDNGFSGILDVNGLTTTRFSGLMALYADDNEFSSLTVPTVPILLDKLDVSDNSLQDFSLIGDLINNVTTLRRLYTENSMDTATVQDSLDFAINPTSPSALEILDLSNNLVRGFIPIGLFENLNEIKVLSIQNNRLRGPLPQPIGSSYLGLDDLIRFNISNNFLEGDLRIDWFLENQVANLTSATTPTPIKTILANNNQFTSVQPSLNSAASNAILAESARFLILENIEVQNNNLSFKDLFRIKRLLNFQQIISIPFDYYIPQNGIDATDFVYAPQGDLGIGGIRRRVQGSSILFSAGPGIISEEQTLTNYLTNKYTWERVDTAGLIGGTAVAPVTQALGLAEQAGGIGVINLTSTNLILDPSFLFGVDTTASNIHRLAIPSVDSATHDSWLYRAQVKNDSFSNLTLFTKLKKIEVGLCTDSSGAQVFCQSIIVQFEADSLAQFSTLQEQDSFKTALRESLGIELIESCLCGDIELWSISDTARVMLESNGKGTKRAASSASGRPQLLSADPNYPLLGSSSNPTSSALNLPAGSGNSTAKTLVAIIDSGVDYDYPALTPYISEGASSISNCLPNATFGYNFIADNNNATDDHGHGTSIAGIVAGISQQSILPDTGNIQTDIGILPLKYTDKNGAGSLFHAACALRYAADYERVTSSGDIAKVRVVNASWGYYGDPCIVLENTIQYAGEDCDILIVASAGNDSINVHSSMETRHWPSNSIWDLNNTVTTDNVLAVAGLTPSGNTLNLKSNYSNIHIDLAAPWNENTTLAGSVNGFNFVGGTSFAAPQVSRAAALLFDKYPDASYFAVKYALMNGVDVLPNDDSTKLVSGGRINYAKADSILNIITDRTACNPSFTVSTTKVQPLENQIKIYPNPVADLLTLELNYDLTVNKIELRMFNISGQEIKYQSLPSGTTSTNIKTEDLSAGVYFIQITVDEQQYSQKVIKF